MNMLGILSLRRTDAYLAGVALHRWGPRGLDAAKMEAVLERLAAAAEAASADATVLRRRQVNVATMGDAGWLHTPLFWG